jgi:hypothetical protein
LDDKESTTCSKESKLAPLRGVVELSTKVDITHLAQHFDSRRNDFDLAKALEAMFKPIILNDSSESLKPEDENYYVYTGQQGGPALETDQATRLYRQEFDNGSISPLPRAFVFLRCPRARAVGNVSRHPLPSEDESYDAPIFVRFECSAEISDSGARTTIDGDNNEVKPVIRSVHVICSKGIGHALEKLLLTTLHPQNAAIYSKNDSSAPQHVNCAEIQIFCSSVPYEENETAEKAEAYEDESFGVDFSLSTLLAKVYGASIKEVPPESIKQAPILSSRLSTTSLLRSRDSKFSASDTFPRLQRAVIDWISRRIGEIQVIYNIILTYSQAI